MDRTPADESTEDRALRREAAAAGLRRSAPVSADSVKRRRRQLWLLVGLTFAGGATALGLLTSAGAQGRLGTLPPETLGGISALVVGFALYCVEKEVHLRRVERMLAAEREFSAEVSARLDDLGALLRAGKTVNSALELNEVLDTILETTLGMFDGASGSILLLQDAEALTVVSARGNTSAVGARTRIGDGIAGHVAETREPVLLNGPAQPSEYPGYRPRRRIDSAMCVPLLHRDALVGVLNVTAASGHAFEPDDLELLSLFAEHAASGIAHARVHAEERARIDEMVRLEQMKTDFITGVSHDLRTPLTSIVGCTAVARRADLTTEQRDEVLAIAEQQALKLSAMVERMLLSAELGVDPNPASITPFDALDAVREIAAAHAASGRLVTVRADSVPRVLGDRDRLVQVLDLLLENAFRHGAPPVELAVSSAGGRVAVTVADHGVGVPEGDRERVFERFVRLDASRGTPGVGLGLSIVRGLVATMGATVSASDAGGGGGAAFTVELVTSSAGAVPIQESGLRLVRESA